MRSLREEVSLKQGVEKEQNIQNLDLEKRVAQSEASLSAERQVMNTISDRRNQWNSRRRFTYNCSVSVLWVYLYKWDRRRWLLLYDKFDDVYLMLMKKNTFIYRILNYRIAINFYWIKRSTSKPLRSWNPNFRRIMKKELPNRFLNSSPWKYNLNYFYF